MSSVLPLIAVIVTVIAGWALIKRVQTHMVLLFAGLAIAARNPDSDRRRDRALFRAALLRQEG